MWRSVEDYPENVPAAVQRAAEDFITEIQDGKAPRARIVAGWRIEAVAPGEPPDAIEEAIEEIADRTKNLMYEAFVAGNPGRRALALVRPPERWWQTEALQKLFKKGTLVDTTYGNDACPSLGAELTDGTTLRIFTGHPHPDHHTRQDGCDPRFAIFVGNEEWEIDWAEGPVWQGEDEDEAARQVIKTIRAHGGARREFRLVGRRHAGL